MDCRNALPVPITDVSSLLRSARQTPGTEKRQRQRLPCRFFFQFDSKHRILKIMAICAFLSFVREDLNLVHLFRAQARSRRNAMFVARVEEAVTKEGGHWSSRQVKEPSKGDSSRA
jgi:hypothetical protein